MKTCLAICEVLLAREGGGGEGTRGAGGEVGEVGGGVSAVEGVGGIGEKDVICHSRKCCSVLLRFHFTKSIPWLLTGL